MPILDKNNAAKVAEYTEYMETSPWANATQDLAWSKVKAEWADEQVYVERDGKIVAAMSLLIRKVFGKASMIYATRGPICDFADTALVQELVKEIDAFHNALFQMPEMKSLDTMRLLCIDAQPTSDSTEYNLYSETEHFHIWLRLITRNKDYNLYCKFFLK